MKIIKVLFVLALAVGMLGIMPKPAAAVAFTYTTGFQVQNLANSQAQIQLTYYTQQTDTTASKVDFTGGDTIPALGSKTYFPIQASTGFAGSVVISSNAPLASIVNLVGNGGTASYIGLSQGAQTISLPLLMKGNAGGTLSSWFTVQNTGTANANVKVAYSDGTAGKNISLTPNASYVYDQSTESHTAKVFAGTVTSDQPVAVVVVQEWNSSTTKTVSASNGFDLGETNAYMPLVNQNNAGTVSGINLQNMGSQPTTITLSYTPVSNGGTACTETQTVPANSMKTFALAAFAGVPAQGMTTTCTKAKFVGSAQVTTNSANQPVVAVVTQTTSAMGEAYDSFVPSRVTGNVVFPLIMDRNSNWWTGMTVQNVGTDPVTVNCTFTGTSYTVSQNLAPGGVFVDLAFNKIGNKYVGSATCKATGSGQTKIVGVVNEINTVASGDNLLVYEGINY